MPTATAAEVEARLAHTEELTRRYARYSRSAGGLGTAFGGALALAVSISAALPALAPWQRAALASAPLVWLLAKELLRRKLYQRRGRVVEDLPRFARGVHLGLTLALGAIAAAVVVFVGPRVGAAPTLGGVLYVAFVAALPLVSWFFFWTAEEFIVGVFLFCQAAVVAAGGGATLARGPLVVFVVAIVLGIVQHAQFRKLDRELAAGVVA